MATIRNEGEFEAWLEGKPRDVAAVLAVRLALRVLPILITWRPGNEKDVALRNKLILLIFLATAASWTAAKYPAHGAVLTASAVSAASAASAVPSFITFLSAPFPTFHVPSTYASAATSAAATAANNASASVATAYGRQVTAATAAANIWESISADAMFIEQDVEPSALTEHALWRDGMPRGIESAWAFLKSYLHGLSQDWEVWTDWYDGLLAGHLNESEDLALFRVTLDEESDWEKGPAYVNALIKAKIEAGTALRDQRLVQADQFRGVNPILAEKVKKLGSQLAGTGESGKRRRGRKEQNPALGGTAPMEIEVAGPGGRVTKLREPNARPRNKPKTAIGKAALANQITILVQSEYVLIRIDERLEDLQANDRLNDPDQIEARDKEIENLQRWKLVAEEVPAALEALLESGDEARLQSSLSQVANALKSFFGPNGPRVMTGATELSVYVGFVSMLAHMGVNLTDPQIGLVSMITGGVVFGRKTFVDAIKAWHGGKPS